MAIDKIPTSIPTLRSLQSYEQIQNAGESNKSSQVGDAQKAGGFANVLGDALKEVDSLQKDADNKIEGMILGKGVKTHEAMIALEKADVAFKLMNNIRMRITRAYEEVMRTQI
ncbi:flagellar hook-basal body complex protein FliE [bacterium]|nr:flagellar hook-basal body complex protein FliE [bacterium]